MADSYTGLVKGTSAVLPRGFPWIFIIWYAFLGAILAFELKGSSLYTAVVLVIFLALALYAIIILRNVKHKAFAADAEGIRLGVRLRTEIPWAQVQEIRISSAPAGSIVDIVLTASAPVRQAMPAPLAIAIAAVTGRLVLKTPPLLYPLTNPTRYRVPLFRADATELASSLSSLAPGTVPIVEGALA